MITTGNVVVVVADVFLISSTIKSIHVYDIGFKKCYSTIFSFTFGEYYKKSICNINQHKYVFNLRRNYISFEKYIN